jgi:hypothetical protein
MSNDRPPMTDAEAAAYVDSLDRLYGRLQSIDSRAETLLADARSLGDEEAVARIEAILSRLSERLRTNYAQPSSDALAT